MTNKKLRLWKRAMALVLSFMLLMPSIALAKDMEYLPDTMETEVIQVDLKETVSEDDAIEVEEEIPAEKNNPEKGGNIRFVSENAQGRFDMTMVEFTAPNGCTSEGEYGFYIHQENIDYEDCLTGRENIQ